MKSGSPCAAYDLKTRSSFLHLQVETFVTIVIVVIVAFRFPIFGLFVFFRLSFLILCPSGRKSIRKRMMKIVLHWRFTNSKVKGCSVWGDRSLRNCFYFKIQWSLYKSMYLYYFITLLIARKEEEYL